MTAPTLTGIVPRALSATRAEVLPAAVRELPRHLPPAVRSLPRRALEPVTMARTDVPWQVLVAAYVGVLSLVVWPVAPLALVVGVWSVSRIAPGEPGRRRAVLGLSSGAVGALLGVAAVLAVVTAPL